MPNINIQITNGKDETVTVKPEIGKTMKVKTVHKKSKRKPRNSIKKKRHHKKHSVPKKTKKCLDDRVNNHKVF